MNPLLDDDIRRVINNNPNLQAIANAEESPPLLTIEELWEMYIESTPSIAKELPVNEKPEFDKSFDPATTEGVWEEVPFEHDEKAYTPDSLPHEQAAIEAIGGTVTVEIEVNQSEGKVVARFAGRELVERNPGDWFVERSLQIDAVALAAAWKIKYKDAPLPAAFQTSLSIQGGFSMGRNRLSLLAPTWRPRRQVGKHAAGQKKKAKRRK